MRFHRNRKWIVSPEGKVVAEVQSEATASGDRASAISQAATTTTKAGGNSSFSRASRNRRAAIDG
jgi:hypothetical protein